MTTVRERKRNKYIKL